MVSELSPILITHRCDGSHLFVVNDLSKLTGDSLINVLREARRQGFQTRSSSATATSYDDTRSGLIRLVP